MNPLSLTALTVVLVVALSIIMGAAWRVQKATGNTGWIDVFWTFGLGFVATVASLVPLSDTAFPTARQIMVAILIALWSLRLGWHILIRTQTIGDDPRYRQLILDWGQDADRQMFYQLQKQAGVSVVLAIAVALAAHNPAPGLNVQDGLGLMILLLGIFGEAVADRQLRRFKADPANRNSVCDSGLWHWSRHPNYFFEWICWLAYPLIAINLSGDYPYGWIAIAAPAFMYWALVYISGIPPLEAHMLRTRGDSFRSYQQRTPAFFPVTLIHRPKY
jgi:steroid 5-alpha reductase family enzyme